MQIVIDTSTPLSEKDRDVLAVLLDLGVPTSQPQEPVVNIAYTGPVSVADAAADGPEGGDEQPVNLDSEPDETDEQPKRRRRRSRCKDCGELHYPDDACATNEAAEPDTDTSPEPMVDDAPVDSPDADSSPAEDGPDTGSGEATDADLFADDEPQESGATIDDAVRRATALIAAGRRAEVKAALATVGGAKRVSELASDQVPAFLAALDA